MEVLLALFALLALVGVVVLAAALARQNRRERRAPELPVEQFLRMQHDLLDSERRRRTEELRVSI